MTKSHIRTDATSAEQTLTAVPVDRARVLQQVRRLQDDTAALRARTHSPAWRIGSAVPVLGGSLRAGTSVNRPGVSGGSVPWKGWGHVRENVEEVSGRAS